MRVLLSNSQSVFSTVTQRINGAHRCISFLCAISGNKIISSVSIPLKIGYCNTSEHDFFLQLDWNLL